MWLRRTTYRLSHRCGLLVSRDGSLRCPLIFNREEEDSDLQRLATENLRHRVSDLRSARRRRLTTPYQRRVLVPTTPRTEGAPSDWAIVGRIQHASPNKGWIGLYSKGGRKSDIYLSWSLQYTYLFTIPTPEGLISS